MPLIPKEFILWRDTMKDRIIALLSRLNIWKAPGQDTRQEVWTVVWLSVILIVAGMMWEEAFGDTLAVHETHTWQSDFAASSGPTIYWPVMPGIEHNPAGAPKSFDAAELAYTAWSWSERIDRPLHFIGNTTSTGGSSTGKITVNWIDAFQMLATGRDVFTKGFARVWYYLETGIIAGAEVYLNSTILEGKCRIQAAAHEVGHSMGALIHSNNDHDVMYSTGATDCRYAISAADVSLLQYGRHTCHAELTMEHDIYLPNVKHEGVRKSALLKYQGNMVWKLGPMKAIEDSRECSIASMDSAGVTTITDLRGVGGRLTKVKLAPMADDTWSLAWAE